MIGGGSGGGFGEGDGGRDDLIQCHVIFTLVSALERDPE